MKTFSNFKAYEKSQKNGWIDSMRIKILDIRKYLLATRGKMYP